MSLSAIGPNMTPLEYARQRSASRSVESNPAMGQKTSAGRMTAMPMRKMSAAPVRVREEALVCAPIDHFIYRVKQGNGRLVAKRALQRADSDLGTSRMIRVG